MNDYFKFNISVWGSTCVEPFLVTKIDRRDNDYKHFPITH